MQEHKILRVTSDCWERIPEAFRAVSIEQMEGIFHLALSSWRIDAESFDYMGSRELLYCSVMAIVAGNKEYFKMLTEYKGRKHLMSYILDILILCANDRKEYEIQTMLLDYKYRIGVFWEKKFDL